MPTLPLVGGSGMAAKGACPKRRTQCCKRGRLKAIFLFHLRNEIDPTGRNDFATAFASGSANHWVCRSHVSQIFFPVNPSIHVKLMKVSARIALRMITLKFGLMFAMRSSGSATLLVLVSHSNVYHSKSLNSGLQSINTIARRYVDSKRSCIVPSPSCERTAFLCAHQL